MAVGTKNPFRFGDPVQGDYLMPLPAFVHGVIQVMASKGAYHALLNTLTAIQRCSLRLEAKVASHIFSRDVLDRFEIPIGAALASSIRSLKDKEILDEGTAGGVVTFDHLLFAIWLRVEFPTDVHPSRRNRSTPLETLGLAREQARLLSESC